jgi:DNA repair exonuclease SbcCD ATPase subunit
MMRQRQRQGWKGILAAGCLLVGLSGCDYWPPALQAQIEQLKAEVQAAAAERATLDQQLKEALKAKDDLQARLDELTRLNRELAGNVATLKQALDAERDKVAKMGKPAAKPAAKAAPKSSPAPATAKKKPAKKK